MPRRYSRPQERQRPAVRAHLEASSVWDASTMRISSNGEVTACKDSNKTMRAEAPMRYLVGYASDIIGEDYHPGKGKRS